MRRTLRAASVVALAALFTGAAATATYAASDPPHVTAPTSADLPAGEYIVVLKDDPVATYEGGQAGLAPTAPDAGKKLDVFSQAVSKYSAFLEKRQEAVADAVGAEIATTYQTTLNGFSASLSAAQASKLASQPGVLGVFPDEIRHPQAAETSTQFLGLEGDGGVWEAVGGVDAAGEGVVVGVVDTGIAPENPSFAGDALGTAAGTGEPYLEGNTVVFDKADGTQFRSERVTGQDWDASDYSTKLIGGKYFSAGAAANGFDFQYDYLSPRDGDGHGSHTASTAAGNNGVEANVGGIDFGAISGVAPAAKVAAYKACYVGPDVLVTTDDICALSDLLGAIDTAVADGVDVINYSIGGGAATTVLGPEDISFFNAAAAGVFVAVSAGNDGPDSATADHASPWYTTVAASTFPTYEGTVELGSGWEAPGATITVPFDGSVEGDLVYAGDIPAAGADPAEAALCYLDTIDAAAAAGKIVVCDRGGNARVEKSLTVSEAGGIGAIIVNVGEGSLDNDLHSVPTIHIQSTYRDALLEYVRTDPAPTATLYPENLTGIETPVPQVAGFSSRGPMNAGGSDVLKPDITAPGVAVLADSWNGLGEEPTWEFLSGTSMSSPHVAGLAALYLGERPNASPGEIKSAMMTTAYDTVDDQGSTVTDPFSQGAGHADPTKYFSPGLLFNNGVEDWAAYIQGQGLYDFGVEPIDGSDLNLASISIGSLPGSQTVTRTITATEAATFTAAGSVAGYDVSVSPASVTLAAGESADLEITFTRTDAPIDEWATGSISWTGSANAVRIPVALYTVPVSAPSDVSGTGTTGSTDVEVTSADGGDLALNLFGLAPAVRQVDPEFPEVPGHSGDQDSFYDEGADGFNAYFEVEVAEGSQLARFDLDSSDDENVDLDLVVYHLTSPTSADQQWTSATGSADESIVISSPPAGTYLVLVNRYSASEPFTWDLDTTAVTGVGEGSLTATPNPLPTTASETATYTLSWSGLEAETTYYGVVRYGDSATQTIVRVDSGQAAPVSVTAPTISGTAKVGKTLTATPGTWDPADVTVAYQWLRDGEPIAGATTATYKVAKADLGTKLSVRVTATAEGNPNAGVATSAEVAVKRGSKTTVTMNRYIGTSSASYVVSVKVAVPGGPTATGTVKVKVDSKTYTATLKDGKASVKLPKQSRGVHVVTAIYSGDDWALSSGGVSGFIVLR